MKLHLRYRINKTLHTERSLAITTRVGCVNQCAYCPQDVFVKAYRRRSSVMVMDTADYENWLRRVPKHIIISFAGFSEPFMHPQCTDMILHTYRAGYEIRVNTTCIGIKTEDLPALRHVPFLKFVIHLPDDQGISRIRVDDDYLALIRELAQRPVPNTDWKFHRTERQENIHPAVLSILTEHKVSVRYFGLSNRAGNIRITERPATVRKCGELAPCNDFHHNILFPNGDIGLCHMDWGLKHVIGNLAEVSHYHELYQKTAFREILKGLTSDEAELQCRTCEKSRPRLKGFRKFTAWFMGSGKQANLYSD